MRYAVAVIAAILAALLLMGCGDDSTSPRNRAPEITILAADPDTVDPAGFATIMCMADDPDGDDLTYTWDASDGTISGGGRVVTWAGPLTAGTYEVSVTVDDGTGKSDSDTVLVEVRGGTLLVETESEVLAVSMSGDYFSFYQGGPEIEVVGERIFFGPGGATEFDHSGNVIVHFSRPSEAPGRVTSFAAYTGGFVFMENWGDTLTFVTPAGEFVENVVMPEASSINQGLFGVVVGERLIISETGNQKVVEVDLTTREASIFKDLSHLETWLLDIDYSNGVYYMAQYERIYKFTEHGDAEVLFDQPNGFILYLAVVGKYVYATDGIAGSIYRVDIQTGEGELLVEGLAHPRDIEFLPVALEAP